MKEGLHLQDEASSVQSPANIEEVACYARASLILSDRQLKFSEVPDVLISDPVEPAVTDKYTFDDYTLQLTDTYTVDLIRSPGADVIEYFNQANQPISMLGEYTVQLISSDATDHIFAGVAVPAVLHTEVSLRYSSPVKRFEYTVPTAVPIASIGASIVLQHSANFSYEVPVDILDSYMSVEIDAVLVHHYNYELEVLPHTSTHVVNTVGINYLLQEKLPIWADADIVYQRGPEHFTCSADLTPVLDIATDMFFETAGPDDIYRVYMTDPILVAFNIEGTEIIVERRPY